MPSILCRRFELIKHDQELNFFELFIKIVVVPSLLFLDKIFFSVFKFAACARQQKEEDSSVYCQQTERTANKGRFLDDVKTHRR